MVKKLKNTIATNLMRIRMARRYSQREMAAVLDIKQPSYRDLEIGHTQINAVQLAILADFYHVPIQLFYQSDMLRDTTCLESESPNSPTEESQLQYKKQLETYAKRITELEGKLQQIDSKIDALLSAPERLLREI